MNTVKQIKYSGSVILLVLALGYAGNSQNFIKGVDLSYVSELEKCGVQWKQNNIVKDVFSIFKDNGANLVRLRIWHTPVTGNNGYGDTENIIARAKAKGLKVMLNFHYSDTWADAGKQKCPAAWIAVVNNPAVLADSVYNYTRKTLQKLKDKGLMPEFVQVGNETNGGMCFAGDGTVTWPTNWSKQTLLFNAGIKAVRDVDAAVKIILHVADPKNAEWWAGELNKNNVTDYDILGISYYPLYHTTNTITSFGTVITNIKNTYHREVMAVETGLPWTNSWDDATTNIMNGVPGGYGSSPAPGIQAQWLIDLSNMMVAKGGMGLIYWEPAYVATHITGCPAETGGSVWENVALFDFSNNLMPDGGIRAYQNTTGISHQIAPPDDISLQVIPNPAGQKPDVVFQSRYSVSAFLRIYSAEGKLVSSYTETIHKGLNRLPLKINTYSDKTGVFVLRLILGNTSYSKSFILAK